MIPPKRPINSHDNYHAHVYFTRETLDFASSLCHQAGETFGLDIGRVNQKPVGPHPLWSCQILFTSADFEALIPWLEQHREELNVLVHPVTGDDLLDHTEYAYWLGDSVTLNLAGF